MTTTAAALTGHLRAAGVHAGLWIDTLGHEYVTVRTDRASRYPADTIWPPRPDSPGWAWGPNFEHTAPDDAELDQLTGRILSTLETTPARA